MMPSTTKIGDLNIKDIQDRVEHRLSGTLPDASFSVISFLFRGTTLLSIEVDDLMVGISRCYQWSQPLEEALWDLENAVLREIADFHQRVTGITL